MKKENIYWIFVFIGLLLFVVDVDGVSESTKKEFTGLEALVAPAAAATAAGGAMTATGFGATVGLPLMIIGGIFLLFLLITVGMGSLFIAKISSSPILWVLLFVGVIILLSMLKRKK